jgi:hypothetical protein
VKFFFVVIKFVLNFLLTVLAEQGAFHLSEAVLLISPVGSASEGGEGLLGGGNLADDFISDLCSLIGALGEVYR